MTDKRRRFSSGSTFEKEIGYSRAVIDGDWVFISGTTGYNYEDMTLPEGILEQTEQCLRNIDSAIEQAGAKREDILRVLYIVPNASEFPLCWPLLKKYFGEFPPAATMISAGLANDNMKIEIQVTARKQS